MNASAATLSYSSGASHTPLLGETIDANFRRTVAKYGEREAYIDTSSGDRLTYRQVDTEVDLIAKGLLALDVNRGDRVGIWAPNCLEWFLLQYATARIGAIMVTINPVLETEELRFALQHSGISTLVAAPDNRSNDNRSMLAWARPTTLRTTVFLGDHTWDDMLTAGQAVTDQAILKRASSLSFDDPINIQYTSGTTGLPKGVTLSHHGILNNGYAVGELMNYTAEDRVCVPVPFFHCFGMVMGNLAATTHGACIVVPSPTFDPAATLRAIESQRCTAVYGVPTMFIAELNEPTFAKCDLSSLRTGIIGGAPCPPELMTRIVTDMHVPEITICYGMTETSPVSAQTRPEDSLLRRVRTVGQVHPHLEIKIADPVSRLTVPRGHTGELCTRGYSVMSGYWNDPEKTIEVLADGWMHTGDLAVMDNDGYISIVGRLKDMVIRGGENIYPTEIEDFLYTHPDIVEAHVIGVPDERFGEELMAWIRLREGADRLTSDAVRAFAEGKIAKFKVPRYVRIVESYPKTATGKVRKAQMRAEAIELLQRTHKP